MIEFPFLTLRFSRFDAIEHLPPEWWVLTFDFPKGMALRFVNSDLVALTLVERTDWLHGRIIAIVGRLLNGLGVGCGSGTRPHERLKKLS